jgi:DNA repair protein RAD5
MADREKSSLKGGILCLKMGLGKTICSLALSLSNRTQTKKETTLIVCGKSLIGEWLNDIEKFFGNRLKVLVLHKDFNKNVNSVTKQEILDCDIVLTTYDVIVNTDSSLGASKAAFILGEDGIHKDKIIGFKQVQKPYRNYSNEKGPINLYFISWDRIITDESQKFCNAKTKIFKAMIALYATNKWCLSGTPVKNEDKDIWALFWFCGMSTVNNPKDWSYSRFKDLKLSNLIYTLDYTKNEVKETVKLPGIEKEYFDVELNEMEKKVYASYLKQLDQAIKSSNTRMDLGSNNNFAAILGAFVRLRQTCIAPYLINTEEKEEGEKEKENISEEDEKMRLEKEQIANFMNNKFYSGINSSKIQKILEIIKGIPKGEKVVIFSSFSSCLDLLYFAITGKNYKEPKKAGSKKPIKKSKKNICEEECSVCLNDMNGTDSYKLSCNHTFHNSCLLNLKHLTCPLCRANISKNDTDTITEKHLNNYKPIYEGDVYILDGKVSAKKRMEMLSEFRDKEESAILLINYKVGAEGLNIVQANHVICIEPWWTPAVENQAISRVWRFGQTKGVKVYRIIVKDTIEEGIIKLCKEKEAILQSYLTNTEIVDKKKGAVKLDKATIYRIMRN